MTATLSFSVIVASIERVNGADPTMSGNWALAATAQFAAWAVSILESERESTRRSV
jgi:hypothetical protein